MNGRYRIIKENIGLDEIENVKDGRTKDGWYLTELAMMGYTVKKVGEFAPETDGEGEAEDASRSEQ